MVEPTLHRVTNVGVGDSATSGAKCDVCGELVTYHTQNGQLVATNLTDRERHRHQPRTAQGSKK